MNKPHETILSIIPADNWVAVYAEGTVEEPALYLEPLACFALIEEAPDYWGDERQLDRSVEPMSGARDYIDVSSRDSNYIGIERLITDGSLPDRDIWLTSAVDNMRSRQEEEERRAKKAAKRGES